MWRNVMRMRILMPTRGRVNQQRTVSVLPRELLSRTTLVCPQHEQRRLACLDDDIEVVAQPDANMRIAAKRAWIVQFCLDRGYEKIVMLDDDLVFATRKGPDNKGLRKIRGKELLGEFDRLEEKLSRECPHVGFGARQGNDKLEEVGWKYSAKQVCTLGYYLPIVAKEVRWDLVELRSDMCATLQLLLKGYPNAIWTKTVVDQTRDAPGGCSTWRTDEMSDAEAEKLAALFPDYVSVEQRKYGRLEVTVQWQKALRDGQRNRSRVFVC
jgi:hypothetical protein